MLSASSFAVAGEKVISLEVDNMTCMSCPYQVQSALKRVEGVIDAEASLDTGQAVVTFDDSVTNIMALTEATTNAGYPSREAKAVVN
jgi:mercuric ion binding protein